MRPPVLAISDSLREGGGDRGQLRFARKVPFKDQYGTWASWLITQAKKMGVILRTGTEVTEDMISEGNRRW